MTASVAGSTIKNLGPGVVRFLLIILLPLSLFFHHDFDYYVDFRLCLIPILFYGISIPSTTIIFLNNLSKSFRRPTRQTIFWSSFAGLTLLLSLLFYQEILVLKEIVTFRMHQEDFRDLVEWAAHTPQETDITDTYVEIPEQHKKWSGQQYITIFKNNDSSLRLVAVISRPDRLITYLPNHQHRPETTVYFQYGYGANCSYELAEYWFVCSIWR